MMPSSEGTPVPFDEQAAVEHLERLQHELEESRRRRKDASAAFDKFVSSFRNPSESRVSPPRSTEQRLVSPTPDKYGTIPIPARGRRKSVPIGIIAGGVVAIAAGVIVVRGWRSSPEPASAPPASQAAPAGSLGAAATALPAAAPAALERPATTGSELIAVRDVWVRATVDGNEVVERELEAGARVPLRGRAIVIRAGNAAAVRIVIDGQDRGTLGAEGVVVTRSFTASAGK
jgi:uncharacterized protein DUF4115